MSKKFDVVIGNPPYQGKGRQQIYTDFFVDSRSVAGNVCMIFPIGWQEPKNANNLRRMNNKEVKRDNQIVYIENLQNVFDGITGAEWTNIMLWRKGYDNGLEGKQKVIIDGEPTTTLLPIKKADIPKPNYINELNMFVQEFEPFKSVSEEVSRLQPYGLRTDVLKSTEKYNLPPIHDNKEADSDIRVYTSGGIKYVPSNYPFPRRGKGFESYKIFVPYAWGGWDEKNGLGGSYANIFVGYPTDACIETYLEVGPFETETEAFYMGKYMMTKFFRALLYVNKYSQHSTTAYGAIPQQDFTEDWWKLSVAEIDDKLFEKYNVPEDIKQKVYDNIQTRDESNIIDYGPKDKEMD